MAVISEFVTIHLTCATAYLSPCTWGQWHAALVTISGLVQNSFSDFKTRQSLSPLHKSEVPKSRACVQTLTWECWFLCHILTYQKPHTSILPGLLWHLNCLVCSDFHQNHPFGFCFEMMNDTSSGMKVLQSKRSQNFKTSLQDFSGDVELVSYKTPSAWVFTSTSTLTSTLDLGFAEPHLRDTRSLGKRIGSLHGRCLEGAFSAAYMQESMRVPTGRRVGSCRVKTITTLLTREGPWCDPNQALHGPCHPHYFSSWNNTQSLNSSWAHQAFPPPRK